MPDTLPLCMIGAGGHSSRNMYPYFWLLKRGRVVANADLDLGRAQRVAAQFGIERSYSDHRAMLEREKPAGVLVCVNSTFHAEVAVELLNAGYHVYLEKPSCNTLAEARAMLEAARANDRVCMTAYKKRFGPAYMKTKAIIEGEDFGDPVLLTLLRTRGPFTPTDDPNDAYLLQWGCHVVDLVTYLFGDIASVSAMKTGPSPYAYAVTFRFTNGAVGTFAVSDRIKGRNWEDVAIVGTGGVSIRLQNATEMLAARDNVPFAHHKPDWVSGSSLGPIEQGYSGEIQAFIDAIADGRQPEANIEQSAHTMAIYEAIQQSAERAGELTEIASIEPAGAR
ncbi:MAG: Gfo/Idh/MocA family oxidoreductase [Phycisphaeraceae bacterium]